MSPVLDDDTEEQDPGLDAESEDAEDEGPTLNQDEIDSLLGSSEGEDRLKQGVQILLDSGHISYERLPMLEVVFDRLVRLLSTSMRNFISENVEVSLKEITSVRFGSYLDEVPLPALLGVFRAPAWQNGSALITPGSSLIYSIIDVLLGGRRGETAQQEEDRSYTSIESKLVQRLLELLLKDLSNAFEPIAPIQFAFDRLESNPQFSAIVRPSNACILATLNISFGERGGAVELLIPYSTIEPVRDSLLQMFMGEKFGHDSIWEGHLARELWETEIPITGLLGEVSASLLDVLNWKKGSQIVLEVTPDSDVSLLCGDVPVGHGKMGTKNGQIAVQIDQVYLQTKGKEDAA
ncbi:MAG: flagellar motor switch protein FliM [bacterium]|nr:flagellar motor switch protein FliM [bacterium]